MRAKITAADNGSNWSSQMVLFMEMLLELGENPKDILGNAIYPAAGIVADEIRREINNLPDMDRVGGGMIRGVSKKQRKGLLKGLGISAMDTEKGTYNVKIGFAGYNDIVTAKWKAGQPNAMIARSVESGTSFLQKTPFVRVAVKKVQEKAVKEMENSLDKSFAEMQKKYERGR